MRREYEISRFAITKPPNTEAITIVREPTAVEATAVWKTDATNRNMDVDVKCTRKSRRNWRRNLINTTTQQMNIEIHGIQSS